MCPSLSPSATANIRSRLNEACTFGSKSLPYVSAIVYGKATDTDTPVELLFHTATAKDTNTSEPSADDILWLASCTKLVTGIACMQLVEQGRLHLDDSSQVEELFPELREIKVLQDDGSLVEKIRGITLRMLLTHTAGFGYSFLNEKLCQYNEFSGDFRDFLQPLIHQPGDTFEYGISLDWAGILVERVTGMKLNDYIQQNILLPLGIEDVSMVPSPEMKARVVGIWQRGPQSSLTRRPYPLNTPLETPVIPDLFHSGGAGLFGSIREFGKLLATLLNSGKSPTTNTQTLTPKTVNLMFENQLTNHPDFARRPLPAIKPDLVHPVERLYPLCPPTKPQGWGLGLGMLSASETGRSENTAHWSGLSNVYWWCDRDNGVAGIVASQVLPFPDLGVVGLWAGVEREVYQGLQRGQEV